MKKLYKRMIAFVMAFALIIPFLASMPASVAKADDEEGIVIDGNGEDWNYITPLYAGGGIINKLSAFTKDGILYGKMNLSNAANFMTWHIYFDTDGDLTNHVYGIGADFLIETDILYEFEGDGQDWEGFKGTSAVVTRELSSDKLILEFSVPLEDLHNPASIGIHAATVNNDWADAADCPATVGEYLTVPTYEEVISDEIVGLTPAELEAYLASKEFSGSRSQWDAITYDAVFRNSNLIRLKAVTDGANLFVGATAKQLSNNFTATVLTDTAEYQIKANGAVYKIENGKKVDTGKLMQGFSKADGGFEICIPLENLEFTEKVFDVFMVDSGERLPDDEGKYLHVEPPIDEDAPVITVDGDPSDWAGLEPIGHGEGTLGDLYAIRTNDALYVMTTIKGVTDPESSAAYTTSLFIGTDNDDSTGFIHSGYAKHNTGDVLIQDWHSYGDDRNLEIFYTTEPVILEWNMKKQNVEGYEKVIKATSKSGEYCAEWILPMETLKEITEAVNDDLYICVDRNDVQTDEETYERLTPEGWTPARDSKNGSFAKVPKYRTTFDLVLDDFDLSDWNSVCNFAKHETTVNLVGVKSDEKLYTMILGNDDLTTDNKYYISTDAAGFTYDGRENVSYFIDDGQIYQVTANDTLSSDSESVYQYYEAGACLMQLYLSQIGNPAKVSLCTNSNDGEYVLPEEGYLTISKTIEENREEGVFYPRQTFDFYNNPYKGWVGWADINEGDINDIVTEHNLIYVDFKWSELEPEKGVYNFDAIEEQYQFDKWKAEGTRMVLRFVMDNPNLVDGNPDIKRMDIPQWLYDELEAENAEGEGAGVFYTGQTIKDLLGGCGFSPNYKSPKLREYHAKVVKALAERYDDPSICAYVEVGSLGHWAEFHTWPTGTGEFPDPPLAQEYMQAYVDAFKNVRVGIRKPYAVAAENNWGLYNDIFGVTSDGGTPTFLEWAASGNTDMPGSTPEDISASAMPDWWKLNYSGGEFANGDFRTNALDENICAVLGQIRDSHTTWLGPCSACDFKTGNSEYEDFEYNIHVLMKQMGYNYSVYSITQPEQLVPGQETELAITWNNSGVAPIYYNCPVTLMLKNASGVAYEQQLDVDTTTWQPGRTTVKVPVTVPADLAKGEYTLAIKMTTGDANAQIIKLAMVGEAADGSYDLYTINVGEGQAEAEPTPEVKEEEPEATATPEPEATEAPAQPKEEGGANVGLIIGICAGVVCVGAAAALIIRSKKKRGTK